jgi:SagB-type dehydrogenase family enzyme
MKRLAIFIIILIGLAAVCLARHESVVSSLKTVRLSEPRLTGRTSLEQTLAKRRSVRQFTGQQLSAEQISQLAWAGQGITEKQRGFRTAPSAGALYPIKLYFVTQEGMFVYNPHQHSLEQLVSADLRHKLAAAAFGQKMVADVACNIIIVGSEKKLAVKYTNKARRYMFMEAGHVSQNILLQAVALQLGAVPVGGFDTDRVGRLCKLPADNEPLLIICVGHPAG